jgi:hypothetical protein
VDDKKTYINGCNGNCYQGRWCECKEEAYFEKEHKKELIISGIVSFIVSVTVLSIFYFAVNFNK